jgi:hypothetical protein
MDCSFHRCTTVSSAFSPFARVTGVLSFPTLPAIMAFSLVKKGGLGRRMYLRTERPRYCDPLISYLHPFPQGDSGGYMKCGFHSGMCVTICTVPPIGRNWQNLYIISSSKG